MEVFSQEGLRLEFIVMGQKIAQSGLSVIKTASRWRSKSTGYSGVKWRLVRQTQQGGSDPEDAFSLQGTFDKRVDELLSREHPRLFRELSGRAADAFPWPILILKYIHMWALKTIVSDTWHVHHVSRPKVWLTKSRLVGIVLLVFTFTQIRILAAFTVDEVINNDSWWSCRVSAITYACSYRLAVHVERSGVSPIWSVLETEPRNSDSTDTTEVLIQV
jgi:hypothetical protein